MKPEMKTFFVDFVNGLRNREVANTNLAGACVHYGRKVSKSKASLRLSIAPAIWDDDLKRFSEKFFDGKNIDAEYKYPLGGDAIAMIARLDADQKMEALCRKVIKNFPATEIEIDGEKRSIIGIIVHLGHAFAVKAA